MNQYELLIIAKYYKLLLGIVANYFALVRITVYFITDMKFCELLHITIKNSYELLLLRILTNYYELLQISIRLLQISIRKYYEFDLTA